MTSHSNARAARLAAPLLIVAALGLAGCATTDAGSGGEPVEPGPIAAPGPVAGQGTVLQKDGEPAELCLGAVAESYPPQCSGPELIGWDWTGVEMSETASGVTWGAYAVVGTWDGVAFTVTEDPVPLALYDPPAFDPDPRTDPANAGESSEDELLAIQEELHADAAATSWTVLSSWPENGFLFVTVIYDDGTIQGYYDGLYGPGVIAIQSALRDLQ